MNRVVLAGRITKDPELRTSPNGVSFTAFTIAVNRAVANAQGERVADFINCVAFNKQAENLSRYIRKGGLIGVDGKLQTRTYQAQDGSNRYVTEVICDGITFLESRSSQNSGYNDYSSYENNFNQQPQQNNNPRNSYVQPQKPAEPVAAAPVAPAKPEQNGFNDIEEQFDISEDDLPF